MKKIIFLSWLFVPAFLLSGCNIGFAPRTAETGAGMAADIVVGEQESAGNNQPETASSSEEDIIASSTDFQEKGCAGWYAENEYRAEVDLKNISEIESSAGKEGYSLFDDGYLYFYYPDDWEVLYNGYMYIIKLLKDVASAPKIIISIEDINNFKKDYNMCMDRCFDDASSTAPFSWKSKYCSESDSSENLEKILSEKFVEYRKTGGLPPGGACATSFIKSFGDKIIKLGHSCEEYLEYPKYKEIYKGWDELTSEDKENIKEENVYYNKEFLKILKSFKLSENSF